MDKCWFVIRQAQYPAPEYAHPGMAFGTADGPLCLGHFIAGPKEIDNVINSGGITPFPRDMRIWLTKAVDFRFSNKVTKEIETSAKGGAPIASAVVGVTAGAEVGVVFKRMMGDTWAVDQLDTHIVQPTMAYLEECRRSAQVAAWVEKNKILGSWKVYMITGLMIARGAKHERKDGNETGKYVGVGVDLLSAVTAGVTAKHAHEAEVETSGEYVNDFVWAIRLTEVSKSLFGSDLTQRVVKKGAVFSPSSSKVDVKAVLAEEGLGGDEVHPLEILKEDEEEFLVAIDGY